MPDGVMQWFDPKTGEGEVIRGGRSFRTYVADVEPAARWAGARVHFDLDDEGGAVRAVSVTTRRGRRSSRHHRRTGSLAGARRADTARSAPFGRVHPEHRLSRTSNRLEVASAWARCARTGDVAAALQLYSSDGVLHTAEGDRAGHARVQTYLERSDWFGAVGTPRMRDDDGRTVLTWDRPMGSLTVPVVACRIEHGRIVEQWIGAAAEGATEAAARPDEQYEPPRTIVIRGDVSPDDAADARRRIDEVVDSIPEPVWFVRLALRLADGELQQPATAQVTLDVDGDLVRARASAATVFDAVILVQRRLRDRLEHRARRRQTLHHASGLPAPGEWRHGDLAAQRVSYFDRPVEERQLIRRKTFAFAEMTPDEAAFDLEQLDLDFYLFRDLDSGQDALIRRDDTSGYFVTLLDPADRPPDWGASAAFPVTIDEQVPTTSTVDEALAMLDEGHLPFVFFAEEASGRGNVVYRRYDGHYGVITPE
jgi:hypothetical protein